MLHGCKAGFLFFRLDLARYLRYSYIIMKNATKKSRPSGSQQIKDHGQHPLLLGVPTGLYRRLKEAAHADGRSVRNFIVRAIEARLGPA